MGDDETMGHGNEGPRAGTKAYTGAGVTVTFEPSRCLHSAECIRGLPEVFDLHARPWIRPDAADPDAVAAIVRRCPSGALQYWKEGGAPEPAPAVPTLTRTPSGRLYVRAEVLVGDGHTTRRETRAVMCGCGTSTNAPYCDGTGPCRDEPARDPSTDARG